MDKTAERAVRRVIENIHENLGERITIDDMARTAMFSKFHFTRVFQRATGISPGRFLSAIRLQEAKRLLLTTSMSVTEISNQVGYSSVGTFSSRFKTSVGLSPTAYRQLRGYAPHIATGSRPRSTRSVTVRGEISAASSTEEGLIFVGLFAEPIPQGSPIRCTVLQRPGPFEFDDVPEGTWYLLAQSVPPGHEEIIGDQAPTVGAYGPITVWPNTILRPADVRLRPMHAFDPPVLLALLDVRLVALNIRANAS